MLSDISQMNSGTAIDDSRQRIPQKPWAGGLRRASGVPPIRGLSRFADAGRQPPHYLLVRIATGWDSFHRLLSEGLGLLFGLSLVLRKQHPFADDFSPRLVFRLHAQDPLLARVPPDAIPPSVGRLRYIINIAVSVLHDRDFFIAFSCQPSLRIGHITKNRSRSGFVMIFLRAQRFYRPLRHTLREAGHQPPNRPLSRRVGGAL